MSSLNQVTLIGRIGQDIDLKYLANGMAVTEISLAVSDRRKDKNGEYVEETCWVPVTLWSRSAEVLAEYAGKGSLICIVGRLKLDTWESDQGKRSKMKVVANSMQLLESKKSGAGGGPQRSQGPPAGVSQGPPAGAATQPQVDDDEQIPF